MKKTILTCDRCGEETDRLIDVGAGERTYHSSPSGVSGYRIYQHTAEWCLNCCIKTGIAKPSLNPEIIPIDPAPTLEDILREIIREEVLINNEGKP